MRSARGSPLPERAASIIRAVVTDIEGTTTPISFVHDVLFPYARDRLPTLLAERGAEPEIAAAVGRIRALAPDLAPLAALAIWQDEDRKIEPLKTLQGIAWRDGYRSGTVRSEIFPDVAPALRRWQAAGIRLAVYSSGSIEAQRLLFGHTKAGDLAPLFAAFFDTTTGPKREAESYRLIAAALALEPDAILFLSDIGAELDAARKAGFSTCQLVRPADGTEPVSGHAVAADFDAVGRRFALA